MGLYATFSATGRNTSFITAKGFSFFQFHSNHLVNLILTQVTFMIIGGLGGGLSGLKGMLKGAVSDTGFLAHQWAIGSGQASIRAMWGLLGSIAPQGVRVALVIQYLSHQLKHLVQGALFLYTLGTIGRAFGDFSLIPELLLQGIMMAHITGGMFSTSFSRRGIATEKTHSSVLELYEYSKDYSSRAIGFILLRSLKGDFSILKGRINTLQSRMNALTMASFILQAATVIAVSGGSN